MAAWSAPVTVAAVPETGRRLDLVADGAARDAIAKAAGLAALPWLDSATVSIASLVDRHVMPLGPDVFMEGYVHGID